MAKTFFHDGLNIPVAPIKDPNSVMDYGCDWSSGDWLEDGETISNSVWLIPDGLTGSNEINTGTMTGVTLSGGVEFDDYTITNRVTTSMGRTDDRSMIIQCRSK